MNHYFQGYQIHSIILRQWDEILIDQIMVNHQKLEQSQINNVRKHDRVLLTMIQSKLYDIFLTPNCMLIALLSRKLKIQQIQKVHYHLGLTLSISLC